MFNLGFGEMIVLAAIGLIFIGPKQLPQLARVLGRTIGELKKALSEVTTTIATNVVDEEKTPHEKPLSPAPELQSEPTELDDKKKDLS